MGTKDIDLNVIATKFAECIEDDQVVVKRYIDAYTELCKFFDILGKVFSFVLSDIHTKLHILTSHVNGDLADHYLTVETMTHYEMENNLTSDKVNNLANGSRTFLRLHRALEFIALFLEKMERAGDDERLSQHSVDAYTDTLMKHHPWIIQKAATLAMKTLGTRMQLLDGASKYGKEESLKYIRDLIVNCRRVYDNVQSVYEQKGLLDLP